MSYENSTHDGCNLTNISYVKDCLKRECVPVSECTRHIEEHVTPGVIEWIIVILYSVIFFVGLLGNGLVCFVVIRVSYMRTVVNIFIVNLAVADFLVLLVCLPPSVLTDITESWYLGEVMCKMVPFLQVWYLFPPTSTFTECIAKLCVCF